MAPDSGSMRHDACGDHVVELLWIAMMIQAISISMTFMVRLDLRLKGYSENRAATIITEI